MPFFKILIFWVVSGIKGQKTVQNHRKFCLSRSISWEPYIMWLSFMVHMCKMIISPGFSFIFSKFGFFGLRLEVQKLVQNKKNSLSHSISQEPYTIWLSFMLHIGKMIISRHFFQFFKILIFQVVRRVKGQKTVLNDKKLCPLHSISQEQYIMWLSFMIHISNMISSGIFFIF